METAPVRQRTQQIRLGEGVLGESRHVCAIFDGAAAASAVLVPFVVDGVAAGDRVVYLAEDPAEIRQRLDGLIDVAAAVDDGQLDLQAWSESYLSDGRFSSSRMLGHVRHALRDPSAARAASRKRSTRLVGEMEWALEGVPGAEELVTYESGIDALLEHSRAVVVCSYDVRRHSASQIAAVLAAHQVAFVGGRLQRSDRVAASLAPRDRILSAASRLFGDAGVRESGVDALIDSAGVAKATFYRHFPSKDDLIVAWLRDPRTRWLEDVRRRVGAQAATPDDVIPRFFEVVAAWLEEGDFRGCPYLNTAIELGDSSDRATTAIRSFLSEVESYLRQSLAAAGYRDAAELAIQVQAMTAGAITLGVAHRTTAFVVAASAAARSLLSSAERA